ncbi:MAG: hypothetical protein H5T73_12630 [Actinobacteria bacterium]|nr:hypothetical protein [Actinomycetota bacterium]
MRKILIATLALALVATLAGLGTFAWFSDTETVVGTFTTGTIKLKVNEPADLQFAIEDLKPCDWKTQEVQLKNIGSNEGPVWLHIDGIDGVNPGLAKYLEFDLSKGAEVIIHPDDKMTVKDLQSVSIPLGWLDPGQEMYLVLSFHLAADTPNEMQGKSCTVNFEFIMTDHNGGPPTSGIILENKKVENNEWKPILGDGIWGICRYNVGSLNLDVVAKGLEANKYYQLKINSPSKGQSGITEVQRVAMTSALAANKYDGNNPGVAPPSPWNQYERAYYTPGAPTTHSGAYVDGDEGIYAFTRDGYQGTAGWDVDGADLAAGVKASFTGIPSGEYKYIKCLISLDESPWTCVLMEKDTPLFFTIP